MQTALVCTLKNEVNSIKDFLSSLIAQTKKPDEIILVDGGSSDGTLQIIEEFCKKYTYIKLIVKRGCNIPEGRNIAIRATKAEIIAVTDVGEMVQKDWFKEITMPLMNKEADVVAGYYYPSIKGWFQEVLSACIYRPLKEINPSSFLPSSRSIAFYRKMWQKVGGYPQLLFAGEDLVFDMRLKKIGARFKFVPQAWVSYHLEPTLYKYFRKWRLYGLGDGQANLWPKRYIIRFGSYILGIILLVLSQRIPFLLFLLFFLILLYSTRPILRLRPMIAKKSLFYKIRAYAFLPIILACGDIAKMCGYIEGTLERIKRFGTKERVNKYSGH